MITNKQINSMVRGSQQNDFSPVHYHVVDYRKVSAKVSYEPVRGEVRESEVNDFTEHGYTVTVKANSGQFSDFFKQVYELSSKDAEVVYFKRWSDAAEFVKANFAELESARKAFYN